MNFALPLIIILIYSSYFFFCFAGCNRFEDVLSIFKESKSHLAEILSAFEFLDGNSMSIANDNLKLTNPIASSSFYVLIETGGSNATHDEETLNVFLQRVMDLGLVKDGTVATESRKIEVLHFPYIYIYIYTHRVRT